MDYQKIKHLFESRFPSQNAAAKAIGMSGTGYSTMIAKHTMTVETLELILRIIDAPITDFFDAPIPPVPSKCNDPQCQYEKEELKTTVKEVKALNAQLTEALVNLIRRGGTGQGEIAGGMETPGKTG